MKRNLMKRLLAGYLAVLMMLSDASGVLASNLSDTVVEPTEVTEIVDSTESSETTETTEVVNTTEDIETTESSEQVEETEKEETTESVEEIETEETAEVEEETETESETELVETPVSELERVQTATVSDYTGPIYKAYFGLPSVLTPKTADSTTSEWQGDRIRWFGNLTSTTLDSYNATTDDVWRILDPTTGLIWADGIFFSNGSIYSLAGVDTLSYDMTTINAALLGYLNSQASERNKFESVEKDAISEIRLLTKEEMMNTAYGFNSVADADATRKLGSYSYQLDSTDAQNWVTNTGGISDSWSSNNSVGYAPAVELDTDRVFMTVYANYYESGLGQYAKVDISTTTDRIWNLLVHSGDTGFEATLPTTAPHDGDFTVEVTGLGSLSYDRVSAVISDVDGNVMVYMTNESTPITGIYTFVLPTELAPGTYDLKVFTENGDGAYVAGYVSNIVEGNLEVQAPTVSDMSVTQEYGVITLHWNIENKRSDSFQTYTYCDIYRATSVDGEYVIVAEDVPCDNSNPYYYWDDMNVRSSGETADNAVYYYKIAIGGVMSEAVTNDGIYYGVEETDGYKGAFLVDENQNKVTSLTLHEGEAKKLAIAFVESDGTVEYVETDELGGARWYLYNQYCTTEEYLSCEEVSSDKIEIYPYEFTEDEEGNVLLPEHNVYIQAEVGATGTYYLTTRIFYWTEDVKASWYWQIPVTVVAAEEGADYGQREVLAVTTQEEAEQKMRDLLVARDYDSYVLAKGVDNLDVDTLYDTYAEREGMKPNEGDYLFYQRGERNSVSSIFTNYEPYSVSFNGEYYTAYKMTTPFITTKEEEALVDKKIDELVHTEGGALYPYKNASDEEKIRAIYDWIVANVNPEVPGDRTTPIYHTVYHTLYGAYGGYPGSGTCGAFAVLFTRLSREMGIASKVIMGTDSAAHAYNVVQLGRKWYFIDTNSKRYLSDATEFTRAQEQSYYLDQRFIDSYLSKIDGNTYTVASDGIAVVSNSVTTETVEFEDLGDAVNYVVEQAALAGNEVVEYTVTIRDGNMAFPSGGMGFLDEDYKGYGDRVTLDLGGNTIIIRDGLESALIGAKYVHNGWISVGDAACVKLYASPDKGEFLYEDMDFIYKSTTSAADNTPMLSIDVNDGSKIVLADAVTVEHFDSIFVRGDVEVNTDLSAKYIELGSEVNTSATIVINGTVTASTQCTIWGGNIDADSLISKKKTTLHNPDKTTLVVGKNLTLAGVTEWYYGATAATIKLVLERQFASEEENTAFEQATINWSGSISNKNYDGETKPMFHIVAKDYVAGELQDNTAFASGTTIGTVTAKGLNNATLTSSNLSDYITVETVDDGKAFADIENNILSVVSLSVIVTGPNDNQKEFSSLKKAIDGLATVAGSAAGSYTFAFAENATLSSNITLPSYVKDAQFVAADDSGISLDFNGKTITTSASILLDANLKLINSAETDGKLATTYASTTNAAVILSGNISEDELTAPTLVDGVNISAEKGIVRFGHGAAGSQRVKATVTAKTLKIAGGSWSINNIVVNNLELCNKYETTATDPMDVTSVLSADTIKIANGVLTVQNGTTLGAVTVTTSAGTVHNYGNLVCDNLTQDAKSKTFLYTGSQTIINESAVLYTTQLARSESEANPILYRGVDATVAFNTSFKRADNGLLLEYAVLSPTDVDDGVAYNDFVDLEAQQVLFTSNITKFPIDLVEVKQASETPKFALLLQKGTNIVAAGDWIIVKSCNSNGVETELQRFTTWKAAMTYINSLSNTSMRYVVEFTEDLDLEEAFTMPTKLSAIIFRGVNSEDGGRINLTYTGDLKLTVSTSFEKINLSAQKYNSTTKKYDVYKSALNLNGKNLAFVNSDAEFGTVAGTTGTLTMSNALLDVSGKINLGNVVSNSDNNRIVYGGNVTSNILTITGTVTSENISDVGLTSTNMIAGEGDEVVSSIRLNAIDITVKTLAGTTYTQGTLLASAKKVAPSWFVVGSTYDEQTGARTGIASTTYKNGEKIYYGVKADAPVELRVWSTEQNAQLVYGSYATVPEAFAEIERVADKTADYYVYLKEDTSSTVIPSTITSPVYANSVFMYSDETSPKTLYFGQQITMKSSLVLQNIVLAPTSATSTIAAGDYCLYLENTTVAAGKKLANITGSGVAKNSSVIFKDYSEKFVIANNLTNIGMLQLNNSKLEVNGTVSVGKLQAILNPTSGYNPTLIGTATVTRNSSKVIAAVAPLITISGEAHGILEVALQEKVVAEDKTVSYNPINFEAEEMATLLENTGIRLANAKNVPSMIVIASAQNCGENTGMYRTTKAAGYVVLQQNKNVGVKLYYTENNGGFSESYFKTFADVVTEINNLRVKRDYIITLYDEISDISLAKPAALTMPDKSYINTLTIEGADTSDIVELYHTGNIALTVPTTLKNVYLEKVVKVGTVYVPIEEQTVENNRLYPAIVTINTGGNKLTIDGQVYFNTPIALNGGGKGIFEVADSGQVVTITNGKTIPSDAKEQLICGSVTNFAEVIVKTGQTFNVSEYGYISSGKVRYTAGNIIVTTLTNAGEVAVIGSNTVGTLKATNLNMNSGMIYSCGTVTATHMNLDGNSYASAEKGVVLASGSLTVKEGATATIEALTTTNGTIKNYGTLICDNLTQNSASKTFLYTGSKTVINENAVFFGTQLARGNQSVNPVVCKKKDAVVAFNGSFKAVDAETMLDYAILAETDDDDGTLYDTYTDVTGQQILFTSNISKFPTNLVEVQQVSATPKYTMLLQRGTNIIAAIEWITVKAQGVDGEETVLKKFTTWKEAMTYLNTLSNTSMRYVVEITEDVDLEEAFTMPTKLGAIIFRGVTSENDGRVNLTYTGDLKLTVSTSFENINLSAQKYNSKTKTYDVYKSALNLAGKNLIFVNSNAEFATVTGTSASTLCIMGTSPTEKICTFTVDKTIRNLGLLELHGATLNVGSSLRTSDVAVSGVKDVELTNADLVVTKGSLATTGTLTMSNALLDVNSKINLVNVVSNSDNNRIAYGGNVASNILTITGTVTGEITDADETAETRANAIDIWVKTLNLSEAGYEQGDLLLNAKKASPVWFVVGSEYDEDSGERTSYISATYKNAEKIYFGEKPDAAVELQIWDEESGQTLVYGSYVTLAEAFSEIERIGDKTANYLVYLSADTDSTSIPKTITTPANAKSVIVYADEASPKTIYFGQSITMKSALVLQNVILAPTSASSTISMGNYSLNLLGTTVAEGKKLGSITGSGIAKDSRLVLDGYDEAFTISGNLTNVGTLILEQSNLAVEGTVNIGKMEAISTEDFTSTLIGTATVTRKSGSVTAVTPQITINYTLYGVLEIALREKVVAADKTVSYEVIDFASAEMENLLENTGIRLANAKNVPSFVFMPSSLNCGDNTGAYTLTKSAGYLVLQKNENVGAKLYYTESNGGFAESYFRTFADVVTEINNLRTKRDYTIYLYDTMADISLEKPAALIMPNKNYVNSLTIVGEGASDVVKLHHTGNITLTTPTTLKGVYLEKVVKVGTTYVAIENQTVENSAKYPAAITLNTGGYALTVDGKVYFNTPVNLNGGSKGTLTVTTDGQLATITNGKTAPVEKAEQLICGGITSFAEVNAGVGQTFTISEYGVFSSGKVRYTAGTLNVTTLTNSGEVSVVGTNTAGTVKLTNANLNDGHLYSCGTMNITNMTLEGEVQVRAEKDFNITGQLVSSTSNATFYPRQKTEKNPVPYLNITGTVTLENPANVIKVGVYPAATVANPNQLVKLETAPKATAQLLTAKTATEAMFVPVDTNVGSVGAYAADNTDGYILKKTGTAIYVYYAEEIAVALCRGNADTGNLEKADVIAYYPTFKDAVTAIDTLKDKTAEYTIVLLQDINTKVVNGVVTPAPAAVTLPTQAANVIITSTSDEVQDIYFTGSLTLRAATEFVKVCFNPMNSKAAGAVFDISAGNYDLTLRDVEVGSATGMALRNVNGSAKQVTTFATEDLMLSGSAQNSKEIIIEKPLTVKGSVKATTITIENGTSEKANEINVTGTFTTDNLVMEGYTVVNAANTLTIKDICNNTTENIAGTQTNTIIYTKNKNGVPLLNVKGLVSGNNSIPVIFNLSPTDMSKTDFVLTMDASQTKYVLSDKKKLAVVEKAALSDITFQLNGTAVFGQQETVKANKGVYVIDTSTKAGDNGALLEINKDGVVSKTYCLDYAQAVNEINNISDANADYTINIGIQNANVTDTNLLDNSKTSAITMPGTNKAASVTITADAKESMTYSGHISYAGDLTLKNLVLSPTADSNITVTKDKFSSTLYMENVTTTADANWVNDNKEAVGFISKITGTKNTTNITLKNCDLRIKGAVSNVNQLVLDATDLITINTVTVNDVAMVGASRWDAVGKATVTNLDVSQATMGYYIASKQTANSTLLPMFTINGTVTLDASGTPSVWKVITAASKTNSFDYVGTYKDVSLVVTAKEDADKFVAYPFSAASIASNTEGITTDNLISYKTTKNEVVNGNKDDMVIRITQTHEGVAGQQVTYAKSFNEAVTIINNLADTTADYRMEILQGDITEPLRTGARSAAGTAYGAMTLPTKANSVTITSGMIGITEEDGEEKEFIDTAVIFYTGTLRVNCDTRFENVALTEGTTKTVNKQVVFTPKYSITPAYTGAFELTFTDTVQTVWQEGENVSDLLIKLASVSIAKGKLTLEGANVSVAGTMTVKDLEMTADTDLTTLGRATITNVIIPRISVADTSPANIHSQSALTITNVSGAGDGLYNGTLFLDNYFTKTTKATQASVTQLAINGTILDANVTILPRVYDYKAGSHHMIIAADAETLNVTGGKVLANQKIAIMPKATTDTIRVVYVDDTGACQRINGTLFKQATALYATTEDLLVRVIGTDVSNKEVYEAEFLTWDQAVNEINKRADKTVTYKMILQGYIGGKAGSEAPLGTITMPTYAKEVIVTSEDGKDYHMMFTGTTLTLRSNTTFENVGLFAVKKIVKNKVTSYQSVNFNINAGNWALGMENMKKMDSDVYVSQVENLSGGAKGAFTFTQGTASNTQASPARRISGFGTVDIYNVDRAEVVMENISQSTYLVYNGISGVTTLNVHPGVILESENGALSVKNLNVAGATVAAKNITVSLNSTLESARLIAGSVAANDGKISLNTVTVEDTENYLSAEQDRNGNTQMTITGTVTASDYYTGITGESAITVDLYYNNYASHAKIYDGMILLNAQKAASSWFEPYYTVVDIDEDIYIAGMGYETDGYGMYKSGKTICYGDLYEMEVELAMIKTVDDESEPAAYTYFKTFEEAVKEIDSLALYKPGTKVFEDYQITLLTPVVEIGNTKGDNKFTAMSLPVKAGTVIIDGGMYDTAIGFAGNLTLRSNVVFKDVYLIPLKLSGKNLLTTKANIAIGNFTLTFDNVTMSDGESTLIGNITGSSKSGTFKMLGTASEEEAYSVQAGNVTGLKEVNLVDNAILDATGNVNVYQLRFTAEDADTSAQIHANGTFTTTLIYKEGTGEVVLGKGTGKNMTINGAQLDLDGDKKKENYTVFYSHPEEENAGKIKIQVAGTDTRVGAKVLASKYLNLKDYSCISALGKTYGTYQSGTSLMLGKKAV